MAGDQATVAALVNTAPRLLNAPAGLLLVTDLPGAAHRLMIPIPKYRWRLPDLNRVQS